MKDIQGYEGLYAITSCGKVWSYYSKKFLKPLTDKDGYYKICLVKDKQKKTFFIHRLVAMTYLDNPNNLPQVNHKDENKTNNCVQNLEWISPYDNCNYGTRNKRISKKVLCIELNRVFNSQSEAARELGLDSRNISKCCLGKYKTTGGLHFQFYKE